MKLWSDSFEHQALMPATFAFGARDAQQHVKLSDNHNPHLAWDDVPDGTHSFVLTCVDIDVPSQGDDVNQADRTVSAALPRIEFCHWVLIDIPAAVREIAAASQSRGVTARGKAGPHAPSGYRHGINDFSAWFAADAQMAGDYYGYDGPCPPWNDALMHRYVFTLFALDVKNLPVEGRFEMAAVRQALAGHTLAQAQSIGHYTLNPTLLASIE